MSLMVTISGIRGLIGSTMTPQLASTAGCAMAQYCGGGCVVVGRDSRPSGQMVQAALTSGLLAGGCDVVDVGIVTTPSVGIMVKNLAANGGVVLTASHNPVQWNGIKFLTADGCAPQGEVAERILGIFNEQQFSLVGVEGLGQAARDDSANDIHVNAVLEIVDAEAIRRRKFKVVLDSVNGAGGPAGLKLLEALGCDVVHINGEPTGIFAHTPEPTKENLTDLCDQTTAAGADIGFAQDPDADRLAIVDEQGVYIGEEYTLALAAKHLFAKRPGPAAANLSTSRMIDDLAAQAGPACVVHRSAVGEANVAAVMQKYNCVFGGEGNGGVIDPRIVSIRDSLTAMAIVLQLLVDERMSLSKVVATMPQYVMLKQKFECDRPRIAKALQAVQTEFASERLSTIDGVRIDWPEGWVHVRASNTEPIMRVIGESADQQTAESLISRVREVVDASA